MKYKIIILMLLLTATCFGQSLLLFDDKPYDKDARIYFASLTTPLSSVQKKRVNTFVKMLKDSLGITSLASKFDVMYLLANETSEAGLKNLVKRSSDATAVNAPVFTAYEGFTAAATKYINTNYIPSSQGVNFTLNSASIGFYNRVNSAVVRMGGEGAGDVLERTDILVAGGLLYYRLNQNSSLTHAVADVTGLLILSRTSGTSVSGYRNGALLSAQAAGSNTLTTATFYILGQNDNGSLNASTAGEQVSFAFAGSQLSATQVRQLTNCIEVYMDSIGTGVIP